MSAVLDAKPSPSAAWLPWSPVIAGLLARVSNFSTNETLAFQARREFLEALIGAMEKAEAARLLGNASS